MHELIEFLIGGVVAGGLSAVLASGLVLTYSTSGIFNFAYGAIAFTVASMYYELNTGLHWPVVWAAVVSIGIFAPLIGFSLYHLMFRQLARASETAQIVATIGLLIALPAATIWVVGMLGSVGHLAIPSLANVSAPPGLGPDPAGVVHLFGSVVVTTDQLAVMAAAVLRA